MKRSTLALSLALGSATASSAQAQLLEGSSADLNLRNFYFDNNNRETTTGQVREWGQAITLNARSGFSEGTVGFGLDLSAMTGIRLDGGGRAGKSGQDRTPSQLFPLERNGRAASEFSRLGMTAKARLANTELRAGTLIPKLPVITANDGRLLPQSFEGVQVSSTDIQDLTLTAGQIERATGRSSSNSADLTAAGAIRPSKHFRFAGGDWKAAPNLTAQYYVGHLENYYQQHFLGLNHTWRLAADQSLKTDLRYFRTRASGRNASAAGQAQGYRIDRLFGDGSGEIHNDTWSTAFTYALGAHSLMLGYQRVSDASNFVQMSQDNLEGDATPGSTFYLLTDRMLARFTRAGERTGFAQYAYDFTGAGVPGLKASVIYLKGTHIRPAGSSAHQKEWERDLALDYVVQSGTLQGLGFGWRHGLLRTQAQNQTDMEQNRLFITYTLPLR